MTRLRVQPDAEWLDKAKRTLEALSAIYAFEEVDIHTGPLSGVRSINVSWTIDGQLSYASLALPNDEVHPHEYSSALSKLLYGE